MMVLVVFSLILGNGFFGIIQDITISNSAIVNGSTSTILIEGGNVLFQIDTANLIVSGLALLGTIVGIALIAGVQIFGSGLSSSSVRIVLLIWAFSGIWLTITILAVNLIVSIEVFGSIFYVMLTIAYAVGVVKKIGGGSE
jgi:hypothetical protein